MRIAYIGNFEPTYSTENDVAAAFTELGHDVVKLQEHRLTPKLLNAALDDRAELLLWTGTEGHWKAGLDAALDAIHHAGERGIATATLHLDVFWGTGRGGRTWWREPMFHTGHVCTADGDHNGEFANSGINHHWLRPAVRHTAAHLGTPRPEYACDVAFVGADGTHSGYHGDVWPYRTELVTQLRAMCQRNGWTFRNPGGSEPKIDRGEAMNDFYASAKVTVGDSLCHQRETSRYWSDRAYEAPGRGGLLVMPRIDALVADYDAWLPSYPWGDWAALEGTIRGLLEDDVRRQAIQGKCHALAAERHTYLNRCTELLQIAGLIVRTSEIEAVPLEPDSYAEALEYDRKGREAGRRARAEVLRAQALEHLDSADPHSATEMYELQRSLIKLQIAGAL